MNVVIEKLFLRLRRDVPLFIFFPLLFFLSKLFLLGKEKVWFICFLFVPLLFCIQSAAKVITVSVDGNADFLSIQEAINVAEAGDIIEVAKGIYQENIKIEKDINLFGAGIQKTAIIFNDNHPDSQIILIEHANVQIEGFTVDGWEKVRTGIACDASSLAIRNCEVKSTKNMAIIIGRGDAILFNNQITDNLGHGIVLNSVTGATIGNNVIMRNGWQTLGCGISISNCVFITVQHNKIQDSGVCGINVRESSGVINKNEIIDNKAMGINIDRSPKFFGTNLKIFNNIISNNNPGIIISGSPQLRGNLITKNLKYGIYIGAGSEPDLGTQDNPGRNTIYRNQDADVYNAAARVHTVTALWNYWGSPDGPGERDIVNQNDGTVLFTPWLQRDESLSYYEPGMVVAQKGKVITTWGRIKK